MSSCPELRYAMALLLAGASVAMPVQGQGIYVGIGRAATQAEVAAWDIDVRPDFKGLPAGSGSVQQGMDVWEAKCASCHGVFGESNQTFSPLVGGTTRQDIQTGKVASLKDGSYPGRTTMMKLGTLSTLWDYINRAMPWTAPKSLTPDEVYAVTAYVLNLAEVVPDRFVLSDRNMADVQARLPNRNGFAVNHGLWPGKGMGSRTGPDVKASVCMRDCAPEPVVVSSLPDFARNAHGNLAEQNRAVGPQRGIDTRQPPAANGLSAGLSAQGAAPTPHTPDPARALAQKHACMACHGVAQKLVGPSFRDIGTKYRDRADAVAYLAGKIRSGGSGQWGVVPMPVQALDEADARTIAQWLVTGVAP